MYKSAKSKKDNNRELTKEEANALKSVTPILQKADSFIRELRLFSLYGNLINYVYAEMKKVIQDLSSFENVAGIQPCIEKLERNLLFLELFGLVSFLKGPIENVKDIEQKTQDFALRLPLILDTIRNIPKMQLPQIVFEVIDILEVLENEENFFPHLESDNIEIYCKNIKKELLNKTKS